MKRLTVITVSGLSVNLEKKKMRASKTEVAVIVSVVTALAVASVGVAAAGHGGETTDRQDNETDTTTGGLSFGQQIAVIVSAQQSNIQHSVEEEEFEQEKKRNATRAIQDRINELQSRIEQLKERKKRLEKRHERGMISDSRYRGGKASLAAEAQRSAESVEQLNRSTRSMDIPAANRVNTSAIKTLKQNAQNMTGQEVSKIARSIAGPPSFAKDKGGGPLEKTPVGPGTTPGRDKPGKPDVAKNKEKQTNDKKGMKKGKQTDSNDNVDNNRQNNNQNTNDNNRQNNNQNTNDNNGNSRSSNAGGSNGNGNGDANSGNGGSGY